MTRLLHIAEREPSDRIWIDPFYRELRKIGELTIIANAERMSDKELVAHIRASNILLTSWGSVRVPLAIAEDYGELGYICNVTGSVVHSVPLEIIDRGIPVTNWCNAPAGRVAEAALTLTLAMVKGLRQRIQTIRAGNWLPPEQDFYSDIMEGLNIGVYGYGFIGQRYVDMLLPLNPMIRIYDPYVHGYPDCVIAVDSLAELVAIHTGLTEETRESVTADLLAMLPDHGAIINTARGAIVDQAALFSELESGRLRAGLDVLAPDSLPADHPARQWDNVILTAHDLAKYRCRDGFPPKHLVAMHRVCVDNLNRYLMGEPLHFLMGRERYIRST